MARLTARARRLHEASVRAARERARRASAAAASRVFGRIKEPTPVWERDWEVLCVLDACRLDLMREVAARGEYPFLPSPEGVDAIWSVGSQSAEWMDRTFAPEYRDRMARTAYVTGNPFTAQSCDHVDTVSGEVLPLGGDDFGLLYEAWREAWDRDVSTIPPRPLTDAAVAVWREREALSVDRMIVHYMQPHAPFASRPGWFFGDNAPEGWGRPSEGTGKGLWGRTRDGELPFEEVWAAYRENLAWVLDDVALLVENCDARVVLTSDHGNGTGEWGVWSHPPGMALPALRRVPWIGVAGRDDGTHRPGLPDAARGAREDGADAGIEERLADLGYR